MKTTSSLLDMRRAVIFLASIFVIAFLTITPAMATNLDPLGGGGNSNGSSEKAPKNIEDVVGSRNSPAPQQQKAPQQQQSNPEHDRLNDEIQRQVDGSNQGREFIRGYNPLSEFDPSGNPMMNWVLAFIGKVTSGAIWLIVAFFFFVTAMDLMYILIPFMRPWLVDPNEDGQGGQMPGFGGGGAAMGGWGAGGANQTSQKKSIFNRQWVSDEAVASVKLLGGSAQAQMGGGGMMGNPMGGMGGFGAQGAAPEQDSNSRRTVLGDWMKARIKVMIMFGIAIVLLTGSTLMGFGMDIGTWLMKFIIYIGQLVSGADVPQLFG